MRALLCVQGCAQAHGVVDHDQSLCATMSPTSIRSLASIAAGNGMRMWRWVIVAAYLQGESQLDEVANDPLLRTAGVRDRWRRRPSPHMPRRGVRLRHGAGWQGAVGNARSFLGSSTIRFWGDHTIPEILLGIRDYFGISDSRNLARFWASPNYLCNL
eukprot:1366685-Pleurochrysis_carterae.AAC.1